MNSLVFKPSKLSIKKDLEINFKINFSLIKYSNSFSIISNNKLFKTQVLILIILILLDTEDICIVERLFSSSLVAVVSLSSPRKLKVCHFKKGTEICNYSYSNTILAVKLNRSVSISCFHIIIILAIYVNYIDIDFFICCFIIPTLKVFIHSN